MAWEVTADLDRFDEAEAWFAERVPYTEEQFDTLDDESRRLAFTVAGSLELRAVQTILDEMASAVAKGEPIEAFEKKVSKALEGQLGPKGYQLETAFRTNVQTSYNTGRWYQITDSEVTLLRPFLMYDSVLDTRTTEICQACDQTVKGHDDPYWLTHCPPLHHRCRSCLRSLRRSEAEARGLTVGEPGGEVPKGFGKAPTVADKTVAEPKKEKFDPQLWFAFEERKGRALVELDEELAKEREKRAKRKPKK